jgi:hypothetical protein
MIYSGMDSVAGGSSICNMVWLPCPNPTTDAIFIRQTKPHLIKCRLKHLPPMP